MPNISSLTVSGHSREILAYVTICDILTDTNEQREFYLGIVYYRFTQTLNWHNKESLTQLGYLCVVLEVFPLIQ